MAMFKAFKPSGMEKIARAMGYQGNMQGFQDYLAQDPMRQQQMQQYQFKAMQMAKGGMVKMREGGALSAANTAAGFSPAIDTSLMQPSLQPTGGVMPVPGSIPQNTFTPRGGGNEEVNPFRRGQFAPIPGSEVGQPLNLQQMSGNFTGNLADAYDPRGISNYIPPRGQEGSYGQAVNLQTGEISQPEYLTGTKDQYNAFLKEYRNRSGPRVETSDVRFLPVEGGNIQGSSTMFGAFQDYLRGQQQAMDPRTAQQTTPPAAQTEAPDNIGEATVQRMYQPGLPAGGVTQAALTPTEAGQYIDPQTGLVTGAVSVPTAMATTAQAAATQESAAAQMQAATASPAVTAAVQATQAAQGTVDPRAQVTAAQQTASSVGNLDAAQGNASLINSPVQREIQAGELISGAADAEKAAQFTEQIQAAEATPSTQATVQGQLAQLTANFDAANPPAWAAGAMRNATAQMAARGLGASSLAGQAIVQATLEAALPIAQADAATVAQFEAQNLSNRQQRAMLAAQQRATFMGMEFDQAFQARVQNAAKISDIANQNFTAEQQVQLENSRAVNTMNLNNLSNRQALVMSQAAALAQMDTQNLNNRQQAAVQNAQNFLQMDMTNLSNQQQTEMFKAQQRIQSLFTDQAAENAARQFNATSQNQVDQFFANLAQQTSQFNAAQVNAQAQFNAGQANTVERFNAELNNQRDTFNAQNQLAIAQANAVWRR
jgi:hypothetical protein